jgi:NADP-dependent 3-hydroxy acid dehydrogenase YdfG
MPVSLAGERVLIVGASSGVGRAAAVLFARAGAKVFATARRADRLEELSKELGAEGFAIGTHPADASVVDEVAEMVNAARAYLGGVDVLVHSTGTNTPDRNLKRLNIDIWNHMIGVNLSAAYYVTQALLPAMREAKKGHLIYVSSVSGKYPDVSGASYQAAKRGLVGFTHAIRVEEKENEIRTCVVCPGLIDTELMEKRPVKPDPAQLARALKAEDVAEIIFDIAKLPAHVTIPEIDIVPTTI